ncbi:MAG: hypothetical protein ABJD07_01665 [Gemmatimonadaceae bacterium]
MSTNFFDRLGESFLQLGQYVPALLGALIILFAGYLLAKLLEKGTDRLLAAVGLNSWLDRGGVSEVIGRAGHRRRPSRLVANIVFWFIMFAVLLIAANALKLEALAKVFEELVSYIPSVIAAIVIILVGIVLGEFVEGLIMASAGGVHGGPTLARVGRGGVVILAIFMALQELGIATDIVTTAFAIIFGAVALGFALAFGLGNRDLAGEVTRDWYVRMRAEREAIDRESAKREAQDDWEVEKTDRRASSGRRVDDRSPAGGDKPEGAGPV